MDDDTLALIAVFAGGAVLSYEIFGSESSDNFLGDLMATGVGGVLAALLFL